MMANFRRLLATKRKVLFGTVAMVLLSLNMLLTPSRYKFLLALSFSSTNTIDKGRVTQRTKSPSSSSWSSDLALSTLAEQSLHPTIDASSSSSHHVNLADDEVHQSGNNRSEAPNKTSNNNTNTTDSLLFPSHLIRSTRHQVKFNSQRNTNLTKLFPSRALFQAHTSNFSFVIMPDTYQAYKGRQWAYLHVWKSGGSTVASQMKTPHTAQNDPKALARKWFTFVRDPIDHFLSGYGECHCRDWYERDNNKFVKWNASDYDHRIRAYLQLTMLDKKRKTQGKLWCSIHSYPQANFMLTKDGQRIASNLEIVGDMREMPEILETVLANGSIADDTATTTATTNAVGGGGGGGFHFDATMGKQNTAAENQCKRKQFPARKDLLSNATMRAICDFVAIDYYLFDFEPPNMCRQHLIDRGII